MIKQKYEKDDIYLDVEKFFSEEDEQPGAVAEQEVQQLENDGTN